MVEGKSKEEDLKGFFILFILFVFGPCFCLKLENRKEKEGRNKFLDYYLPCNVIRMCTYNTPRSSSRSSASRELKLATVA